MEYLWALPNGELVERKYNSKTDILDNDELYDFLNSAFSQFHHSIELSKIVNEKELFKIKDSGDNKEYLILCKALTPGGREKLKNEQRIQAKSSNINTVFKENGLILGVYKKNDEEIICSFKTRTTSSNSPISMQVKIDMIANAYKNGFDQQRTKGGNNYYICAFRKEFLFFYLNNRDWLHDSPYVHGNEHTQSFEKEGSFDCNFSRNRIIFGAPGTGKSYIFNKESIGHRDYPDEDYLLKNGGEYERVTFHPDYSYAQFVGTYKPTTKKNEFPFISEDNKKVLDILNDKSKSSQEKYDLLFDTFKEGDLTRLPVLLGLYTDEPFKTRKKDGTDTVGDNTVERNHGRAIRPYVNLNFTEQIDDLISYEYVPGPFMRTLVKALKNKKSDNIRPHLLLIEEINRANVAAVFGDVFQLLDRDDSNQSEYPIQASEDIKKYLVKELGGVASDYDQIRIPDNMFIWATMNSADQGVFMMDTAFKRRWEFEHLNIDQGESKIKNLIVQIQGKKYKWNEIRKSINDFLAAKIKLNEDKLIGPFFLKTSSFVDGDNVNNDKFMSVFKNKVIMYLFEDAARHKRSDLFSGVSENNRYTKICEAFDEKGLEIFGGNINPKILTDSVELDEEGN